MRLARALQEKLMDVRLRDKLIAEGKVTKEQVQTYLNSLEDSSNNATFTNVINKIEDNDAELQ